MVTVHRGEAMTESAKADKIGRALVEETRTDTVGLWALLKQVARELPTLTPGEARQVTLTVIHGALVSEHVVAGNFVERDEDSMRFDVWQTSAEESVARIDREWIALGREPNLGDVVWFVDPCLLPVTALKHPMGKGWKPKRT